MFEISHDSKNTHDTPINGCILHAPANKNDLSELHKPLRLLLIYLKAYQFIKKLRQRFLPFFGF